MEDNSLYLTIEVEYEAQKFEIKTEKKIDYEELVNRVMQQFNINENKKEYLEFKYKDEDGDTNILRPDDNIFDNAQEDDEEYLIKLNLSISQYKNGRIELKRNSNKDNIINIINIKEDEDKNYLIFNTKNNKAKNEDIETVKKEYQKQIKLINEIYKKQIESIRNELIGIINRKYRKIKRNILKYNIDIEEENLNFVVGNFVKIKENDEGSSDGMEDFHEEEYNDFLIVNNKIESIKIKDQTEIMEEPKPVRKSMFNKLHNPSKSKKKTLNKVKDALKSVYKKSKDYESEIIKKGNEIDIYLKNENLKTKDMNEFFDDYLKNKNKENKILSKDMAGYYIILKKVNHYLENKNIKNILDEYFNYEEEFKDINKKMSNDISEYQKQIINHLKSKIKN
jgi:hypothetical protein